VIAYQSRKCKQRVQDEFVVQGTEVLNMLATNSLTASWCAITYLDMVKVSW